MTFCHKSCVWHSLWPFEWLLDVVDFHFISFQLQNQVQFARQWWANTPSLLKQLPSSGLDQLCLLAPWTPEMICQNCSASHDTKICQDMPSISMEKFHGVFIHLALLCDGLHRFLGLKKWIHIWHPSAWPPQSEAAEPWILSAKTKGFFVLNHFDQAFAPSLPSNTFHGFIMSASLPWSFAGLLASADDVGR